MRWPWVRRSRLVELEAGVEASQALRRGKSRIPAELARAASRGPRRRYPTLHIVIPHEGFVSAYVAAESPREAEALVHWATGTYDGIVEELLDALAWDARPDELGDETEGES